jgi:hypothetical protein
MEPKEQELLGLLQQLIDECRTFEDSEQWVKWFEKDRKELESSLEAGDDAKRLAILAHLRRVLMGGEGAFCADGAPSPELIDLGKKVYRLCT